MGAKMSKVTSTPNSGSATSRNLTLPPPVLARTTNKETKAAKAWKATRKVVNVFNFMILGAAFSIIFGKEINADHILLGMSEKTLMYCSASANLTWLTCFIIHASTGPWSELIGFQGTCHRIICILSVALPILLKTFEPKNIPISVCPFIFTAIVEVTGHFIKFATYVVAAVWLLLRKLWKTALAIRKQFGKWVVGIARAVTGN